MYHTNAERTRAIAQLNRQYETTVYEPLKRLHLDSTDRTKVSHDAYWAMPSSLSGWRPRHHEQAVGAWGDPARSLCDEADRLFAERIRISETPITVTVEVRPVPTDRIERTFAELAARRASALEYREHVRKIFGRLPVSVTPHWVCRCGTMFVRNYWYVAGRRTALQVIIAMLEKNDLHHSQ